ncbi:MAG: hypothetical protein LBI82_09745 [Dysgonamonadaceae bacterium]|jgi:hypothetical protein|nr:hypothetical protein [Dysgonamonadaceae bacterium]
MRKMNFEQMEVINGGQTVVDAMDPIQEEDYRIPGWKWTVEQHIGCAITGALIGGGIFGVLGYGACLLVCVDN